MRVSTLLATLLLCSLAGGDALVVTRAMRATTVAEVFIDQGGVRVELEIGARDLRAFRNVLPDDLYARLGLEAAPFAQRFQRFFRKDWVLAADRETLVPQVKAIEARPRVRRDEITGEPVGADNKPVVFVELYYTLERQPAALTLRPPTDASVGFVAYHAGLPVNDFRYLSGEEILDLDWGDAWFSRFRNRNLRRQYDAPLYAFLYVDSFEVRQEIVVRPKDLGVGADDVIRVADQASIKRKVAELLAKRNPITIDGRKSKGKLDRIHFIRRTLRKTGVIDPPEDLPAVSATLGVVFVYPVDELPQEVTLTWELFLPRAQTVPAVATDEAGGMPWTLTPEDPVLRWENLLKNPRRRSLVEIAPPPGGPRLFVPALSVVCLICGIALRRRWTLGAGLLLAVVFWPFARIPLSERADTDPEEVVTGLLRNIYHAFDYRDEETSYDTLERSVSGELLARVYLETRRALELRNQGGARVKVKRVEILAVKSSPLDEGFRGRCIWNVEGSVGHWGHIHQRRNQYEAVLIVQPVDGVWKITGLELLRERRL